MSQSFSQGHALIVGVGADLPNTVQDAKGLASILQDVGRCAYPKAQVKTLTGPKSKRDAVLSALDELARINADSSVIVYYSGHGYRTEENGKTNYYLMTYGYDLDHLETTTISGAEFASKLGKIKSERLLVLLDCCHAGGFSGSEVLSKRSKSVSPKLVKAPIPAEALKMFEGRKGRVFIASSKASEESIAGEPYSVFTTALIAGLCGEGAAKEDGYVRVTDLAQYTYAAVKELSSDAQHPMTDFEQSDNFVLSYYAGGNKVPKGLPKAIANPKVQTSPGSDNMTVFDQRDWNNIRNVTNVQGNQVNYYGNTTNIEAGNIGFLQPGWTVGTVNQVQGTTKPAQRTKRKQR